MARQGSLVARWMVEDAVDGRGRGVVEGAVNGGERGDRGDVESVEIGET
jgi:hypothetical protein